MLKVFLGYILIGIVREIISDINLSDRQRLELSALLHEDKISPLARNIILMVSHVTMVLLWLPIDILSVISAFKRRKGPDA